MEWYWQPPRPKFSDLLRDAVNNAIAAGRSRHRLGLDIYRGAQRGGWSLSRFLAGNRGMRLDTVDKLVEVLGLEVVLKPRELPPTDPADVRAVLSADRYSDPYSETPAAD